MRECLCRQFINKFTSNNNNTNNNWNKRKENGECAMRACSRRAMIAHRANDSIKKCSCCDYLEFRFCWFIHKTDDS